MPINTIAGAGAINSQIANQIAYYLPPNPSQTLVGSPNMVFNAPNVGLGTVTPLATLQVVGNVGIGTVANGDYFIMSSPTKGGMIVEGNVGIGTWAPALPLSVTGDTYHNGNVGIGTTITTAGGALSVMNGNVGIGTWAPPEPLSVVGANNTDSLRVLSSDGSAAHSVGIGLNTAGSGNDRNFFVLWRVYKIHRLGQ